LAKCDVPISTEKLAKDVVAKYYLADGRWLEKKALTTVKLSGKKGKFASAMPS